MSALPKWMYGDPLEVTIRREEENLARQRKRLRRVALNRARIQALVAGVMRKAAKP
jgi:hypothetical protein